MVSGPTYLRMISKQHGKNFSLQRLEEIAGINRQGISQLCISDATEK
jgi:ATP-binding cassette, subfamily B, bacterial